MSKKYLFVFAIFLFFFTCLHCLEVVCGILKMGPFGNVGLFVFMFTWGVWAFAMAPGGYAYVDVSLT